MSVYSLKSTESVSWMFYIWVMMKALINGSVIPNWHIVALIGSHCDIVLGSWGLSRHHESGRERTRNTSKAARPWTHPKRNEDVMLRKKRRKERGKKRKEEREREEGEGEKKTQPNEKIDDLHPSARGLAPPWFCSEVSGSLCHRENSRKVSL